MQGFELAGKLIMMVAVGHTHSLESQWRHEIVRRQLAAASSRQTGPLHAEADSIRLLAAR